MSKVEPMNTQTDTLSLISYVKKFRDMIQSDCFTIKIYVLICFLSITRNQTAYSQQLRNLTIGFYYRLL